jgi:folate-binding protein YgfZ
MAFDDANILIFTGKDCARFLDGLSSNMIDFQSHSVIDTLVLSNRAKIIAQLHLFMLNNMLISITICEDLAGLKNFLNSKILSQDVVINDVSELNHVDIVYDEAINDEPVATLSETTIVTINNSYAFEMYSNKLTRKLLDGSTESFTNWRVNNLIPWHGFEVSSNRNPYQCGLNYQVHENKGCFTGQEILTRMRTREKGMYKLISQSNDLIDISKASTKGSEKSLLLQKV